MHARLFATLEYLYENLKLASVKNLTKLFPHILFFKNGCLFKGGCPYPSQDMKFPSHSTSATMMDASGGASTSSACSSQPPKGIGKMCFVYRAGVAFGAKYDNLET